MLAERIAGMMDSLKDEMVSMWRDQEQRGCLITELHDQLKTQTMKVQDLEKQVEELKEFLASLHIPHTPDSQETRTPPCQRSPEHSESDGEAAEPGPPAPGRRMLGDTASKMRRSKTSRPRSRATDLGVSPRSGQVPPATLWIEASADAP
ncbi:unnamed protein product [Symbiodinium sp. CCMP2456]|nr:unnamed protein product [Symbiodinium sp. CCMP2456]